jgi:hypothetical protein
LFTDHSESHESQTEIELKELKASADSAIKSSIFDESELVSEEPKPSAKKTPRNHIMYSAAIKDIERI